MSEKLYIDLPKAVELVLANIEERGADYIYTQDPWVLNGGRKCVNIFYEYHRDRRFATAKGCLVGSAFADLMGGIDKVKEDAWHGAVRSTADHLGIEMSKAAEKFLNDIQMQQDSGLPWGNAFAGALVYALRNWLGLNLEELSWLNPRPESEYEEYIASKRS